MSLLHISLFGKFQVKKGQQQLTGFNTRKVQELFSYLLLNHNRPHPREALANLLWNDQHTEQPNRCLRKVIWQLRMALDSQAEKLSNRVLLIESDWIRLNPDVDLWLDVNEFEQAFACVQQREGKELDPGHFQTLKEAVSLYRGGLQESWYQDWYLYERERLQHIYLVILEKLMDHCEIVGDYISGLTYGTLILDCERAQECIHRRMMRLYHLTGNRTAALRQYEQCVSALKDELDVAPAMSTKTLYQQIHMDQLGSSIRKPLVTGKSLQLVIPSLSLTLSHLKSIQVFLIELQNDLQQDIQSVEQALHEYEQ